MKTSILICLVLTLTTVSLKARQLPNLTNAELQKLPLDGGKNFNRLIFEKSPYLLQHARNPVDWRPWSQETLNLAQKKEKPIFLSVGYSSCHWCHVMERESFNDIETAKILNDNFIPVKIDREERPDIDRIYMTATQLIMQGRGGWPNNVWLTPNGLPFYAGTYFSKAKFQNLLSQLTLKWSNNREEVISSANYINTLLQQMLSLEPREAINVSEQYLNKMLQRLESRLNKLNSSSTKGPKFPPHQILHFITNQSLKRTKFKTKFAASIDSALRLLKTLAFSGLYDHLAGGFHRYSTDGRWFLPHYEKMLYDNTQLAQSYAAAYAISKDSFYKNVALEIFDFLERDMITKEGLYASAIDAESENQEGLFYFWTTKQLRKVLNENEYLNFSKRYGIREKGNFKPENGSKNPGFNLLSKALEKNWNIDKLVRQKLWKERSKRVWPLIDDKVLCDWNALAIESLAKASKWLNSDKLLIRAKRIANQLINLLWSEKTLYHHGRNGQHGEVAAYLSDYAYLARALISLSRVTGESSHIEKAHKLLKIGWKKFYDEKSKNLFNSSDEHQDLIFRVLDLDDNVLPSAPAVFLEANLESKNRQLRLKAMKIIPYYMGQLIDNPAGSVTYLNSLLTHIEDAKEFSIKKPQSANIKKSLKLEKHPLIIEASSSKKTVNVTIKIKDGFHINSAEPYQEYLIPTRLDVVNKNQITYGKIIYPDGEDLELDFSDEELSVYEGILNLKFKYEPKDSSVSKIHLNLNTQACSESECLPPQKHEIILDI